MKQLAKNESQRCWPQEMVRLEGSEQIKQSILKLYSKEAKKKYFRTRFRDPDQILPDSDQSSSESDQN